MGSNRAGPFHDNNQCMYISLNTDRQRAITIRNSWPVMAKLVCLSHIVSRVAMSSDATGCKGEVECYLTVDQYRRLYVNPFLWQN
jgi:hypothetical protein